MTDCDIERAASGRDTVKSGTDESGRARIEAVEQGLTTSSLKEASLTAWSCEIFNVGYNMPSFAAPGEMLIFNFAASVVIYTGNAVAGVMLEDRGELALAGHSGAREKPIVIEIGEVSTPST